MFNRINIKIIPESWAEEFHKVQYSQFYRSVEHHLTLYVAIETPQIGILYVLRFDDTLEVFEVISQSAKEAVKMIAQHYHETLQNPITWIELSRYEQSKFMGM